MRQQPGEMPRDGRLEYSNPGLSARRGPFGWWLNLTAPPKPRQILDVATRERLRKAELTSYIILAVFGFLLMLVSNSIDDPATGTSVGIMALGLFIAIVFNRLGLTRVAAFLVPTLLSLLIALAVAGVVGLDVIALPAYDLFAVPIFLSSLIISRRAPWMFALIAIAFIGLDFNFQSHALITASSPRFGSATSFDSISYYTSIFNPWGMINRAVGLNLIAALIGWLGARSTDFAIARADRSDELAELERRELDRTHELEEGVRQLLAVHVHLANGDFNVRAPAIRNSLLWQIGSSLNNLVARLARMAQADFVLRRTQEEANRLVEALYAIQSRRQPIWPAPSQTPLDRLVETMRNMFGDSGGRQLPPGAAGYPRSAAQPGSAGGSGVAGPASSPYPGAQPRSAAPDWMQALMPQADVAAAAPAPQPPGMGQMPYMPQAPQAPQSPQPPQMPSYSEGPGMPMPNPPGGFGAPAGQGYTPQPPTSDVNPWSLEPGEPLEDANLPEWLRRPQDGHPEQ